MKFVPELNWQTVKAGALIGITSVSFGAADVAHPGAPILADLSVRVAEMVGNLNDASEQIEIKRTEIETISNPADAVHDAQKPQPENPAKPQSPTGEDINNGLAERGKQQQEAAERGAEERAAVSSVEGSTQAAKAIADRSADAATRARAAEAEVTASHANLKTAIEKEAQLGSGAFTDDQREAARFVTQEAQVNTWAAEHNAEVARLEVSAVGSETDLASEVAQSTGEAPMGVLAEQTLHEESIQDAAEAEVGGAHNNLDETPTGTSAAEPLSHVVDPDQETPADEADMVDADEETVVDAAEDVVIVAEPTTEPDPAVMPDSDPDTR